MKRWSIVFVILFASSQIYAQINARDSILANERTLDRPLNVHKAQLRITAGYAFSYHTKRYDADGEKTKLMDDGLAYAQHRSVAEIKYGITEHLQLSAMIHHRSSTVRSQELYFLNYPEPNHATRVNETESNKGFDDLFVGLDFRVPLKTRKLDILISAGSFIPTAESETPQPDNSLEVTDEEDWNIVYRNFNPHGDGTLVPAIGASIKYRFKTVGITVSGMHYSAMNKDVEDVDWTWYESKEKFVYTSSPYTRGIPDRLQLTTTIEFQPTPFFNFFLHGEFIRATKGWREWEDGVIEDRNFSVFNAGAGFELIITPRIWFRETVTSPLSGENIDSGIQFYSTLSYNLFVK